mgnify:CR=1 FL=1
MDCRLYLPENAVEKDNVLARLYYECEQVGLLCVLNYSIKNVPFSAVIVDGDHIIAAIMWEEVYGHDCVYTEMIRDGLVGYMDIPLFLLYSIWDIPVLVRTLLRVNESNERKYSKLNSGTFAAVRDAVNEERKEKRHKRECLVVLFMNKFWDYEYCNRHQFSVLIQLANKIGYDTVSNMIEGAAENCSDINIVVDWLFDKLQKFLNKQNGVIR